MSQGIRTNQPDQICRSDQTLLRRRRKKNCTERWTACTFWGRADRCHRAARPTVGHDVKNTPKIRFKNLINCWIILVDATFWPILKEERAQRPETEVFRIRRNFHGKTREITLQVNLISAGYSPLEHHCEPHCTTKRFEYRQRWV